jgi:hypothetical protein
MSKTPVATYNYYSKVSEIRYNKSVDTLTTFNSNRTDQIIMSIFNLYDAKTDIIIGESPSNYFSTPSLNSSTISYRTIIGNINLYDKVIVFGIATGAIYDSSIDTFIYEQRIIDTKDILNNPVQLTKLPDDPLYPDRVYYSLSVFE